MPCLPLILLVNLVAWDCTRSKASILAESAGFQRVSPYYRIGWQRLVHASSLLLAGAS